MVPLSLLAPAFTACTVGENEPGSYDFFCQVYAKISDEEAVKVRQYLDGDSYFSATTTYNGSFDECTKQAVADFQKHCDAIDESYLKSLLHAEGEYIQISLYLKGNSNPTMYKTIKY